MEINDPTADFELTVFGRSIRVHKSFLQSKSPRLETLLSGRWPSETNEYSYGIIYKYLHFLYHDHVDFTLEEAKYLHHLALSYNEENLKKFIESELLDRIYMNPEDAKSLPPNFVKKLIENLIVTYDNVETLFAVANQQFEVRLGEKCAQFVHQNCTVKNTVWYEFLVAAKKCENTKLRSLCNAFICMKYMKSPTEWNSFYEEWLENFSPNVKESFELYDFLIDYPVCPEAVVRLSNPTREFRWAEIVGQEPTDEKCTNPKHYKTHPTLYAALSKLSKSISDRVFQFQRDIRWSRVTLINEAEERTTFGFVKNYLDYSIEYGQKFLQYHPNNSEFHNGNSVIRNVNATFGQSLVNRYSFIRWQGETNEMLTELHYILALIHKFQYESVITRMQTQIVSLIHTFGNITEREHRLAFYAFLDEPNTIRLLSSIDEDKFRNFTPCPIWFMFELYDHTSDFRQNHLQNFQEIIYFLVDIGKFDFADPILERVASLLLDCTFEFEFPELTSDNLEWFMENFANCSLLMDGLVSFICRMLKIEKLENRKKIYAVLDKPSTISLLKSSRHLNFYSFPLWLLFEIVDYTSNFREKMLIPQNIDRYIKAELENEKFNFTDPKLERVTNLLCQGDENYVKFEHLFADLACYTMNNVELFIEKFAHRPVMINGLIKFISTHLKSESERENRLKIYAFLDKPNTISRMEPNENHLFKFCPLWVLFELYEYTTDFCEKLMIPQNLDRFLDELFEREQFDFNDPNLTRIIDLIRNGDEKFVRFKPLFVKWMF